MAEHIQDVTNATWMDRAYNRGVLKRKHPLGLEVLMFADTPGVFYNAHGTEVDPDLAQEAGFDTERLLKEKSRRDRIADATAQIDAEFSLSDEREVVGEVNGYRIVKVGARGHQLVDEDDNVLTPGKFLAEADAQRIASKMKPGRKEKKSEQPEEGEE